MLGKDSYMLLPKGKIFPHTLIFLLDHMQDLTLTIHTSHRFQYYSLMIDQVVQNSNKNITVRIGSHDTASDFVKDLRGKYLHLQRENWPPKG